MLSYRSRIARCSLTEFRSCAAHSYGFTLAEVLITLTILGIVAVIGISSLVQTYKKRMVVSRLKIAYSMLDNMTRMSYAENGYPPNSTVNTEIFYNYFGKYLNIAKDCGTPAYATSYYKSGCFKRMSYRKPNETENAKDDDGNELKIDGWTDLDGSSYNQGGYGQGWYYKVLLKNGMGLGVCLNHAQDHGYSFLVDIDGPNHGDSKLGQDVFQFTYFAPANYMNKATYKKCKNPGLFLGAYFPSNADKSCLVSREVLLEKCMKNGKYDTAFRNGSGCSGLIIKDGWKISSDDPWGYAHKK